MCFPRHWISFIPKMWLLLLLVNLVALIPSIACPRNGEQISGTSSDWVIVVAWSGVMVRPWWLHLESVKKHVGSTGDVCHEYRQGNRWYLCLAHSIPIQGFYWTLLGMLWLCFSRLRGSNIRHRREFIECISVERSCTDQGVCQERALVGLTLVYLLKFT